MILRIFFSVMAFVVVNINGRTEKFSQFYTERTFEIDSLKNLGNSNKNKKYCATCPRIYFPVCGTDDKTYTNECILYCLNQLVPKNVTVKMVRQGPCKLFPGDEVYFK